MIEAYMDESGIHDGAHVCVIAGYWGKVKQWKPFEKRWREILRHADEPTLKEFHSTEFWNAEGHRKGVFTRWSDAKADKFIDDLVTCIVETKIFPTSSVLVVDEWKKLNKNERTFLTGGRINPATLKWIKPGAPNKTYFFPFQLAIVHPANGCARGLHVHYTFDLNKQFKNHASSLYQLLKADETLECRHQLGALDMEIGEVAIGLQAADMLAYQNYKWAKVRIERGEPVPMEEVPTLLRRLLTNARDGDDFPFLDATGLNIALQPLPEELRTPGFERVDLSNAIEGKSILRKR